MVRWLFTGLSAPLSSRVPSVLTPTGDRRLYSLRVPGIKRGASGFSNRPGDAALRGMDNAKSTSSIARENQAERFAAEALASIDSLYRTALRLTRVAADAEDLVQDTYLKAFRAADSFEPGTNLRAWLFTILHNTARNRVRDRAREPVTPDSEAVERAADVTAGRGENPETLLLRDALGQEMQAAIDDLPDVFRTAVWLRDVEEFSYAEIAAMLDIPAGTVMSRISRGRRMLFERLKHVSTAHV